MDFMSFFVLLKKRLSCSEFVPCGIYGWALFGINPSCAAAYSEEACVRHFCSSQSRRAASESHRQQELTGR